MNLKISVWPAAIGCSKIADKIGADVDIATFGTHIYYQQFLKKNHELSCAAASYLGIIKPVTFSPFPLLHSDLIYEVICYG